MTDSHREGHNGHQDVPTSAQRIRSGFDRRKNWGESIDNVYRRIDSRLSELVRAGGQTKDDVEREAEEAVRRHPGPALMLVFAAGLLFGFVLNKNRH